MNELAAAELYLSLAKVYELPVDLNALFNKVMKLRKAQGEFQHHDAITGTEGQAVADDYTVQMEDGSFFATEATATVLGALLNVQLTHNLTIAWEQMEKGKKLGAVLVNDQAQALQTVIRAVVPVGALEVTDAQGKALPFQINEIPAWSVERLNGTHVVYVEVKVPALGLSTIYFAPRMTAATVPRGGITRDEFIENDAYRLTFENGALATVELKKEGMTIPFTDSLLQYEGRFGYSRNSGAYAFIPA